MNSGFKAIGVDPGDVPFRFGNCLELRRSRETFEPAVPYSMGLLRGSAQYPNARPEDPNRKCSR